MPFLQRHELDPEMRAKAEKSYKAQLRRSLTDPSLTEGHREHIQGLIAKVGERKLYEKSPPKPGAISLLPLYEPRKIPKGLDSKKKLELIEIARGLGLDTKGTRAEILTRVKGKKE